VFHETFFHLDEMAVRRAIAAAPVIRTIKGTQERRKTAATQVPTPAKI
jgi:hypothetical protein